MVESIIIQFIVKMTVSSFLAHPRGCAGPLGLNPASPCDLGIWVHPTWTKVPWR